MRGAGPNYRTEFTTLAGDHFFRERFEQLKTAKIVTERAADVDDTTRIGSKHLQARIIQKSGSAISLIPTKHCCADLLAQTASAIRTACSISTATTRDTPCSCMVIPTSCEAISMVILLWLM